MHAHNMVTFVNGQWEISIHVDDDIGYVDGLILVVGGSDDVG